MDRFSREEREWLRSVGWHAGDPGPWTAGAPALADDITARLQQSVRARVGLAAEPGATPSANVRAAINRKRRHRRRMMLGVAALFVIAAVLTVAMSPAAQGVLTRMLRFVPGFGITESPSGTVMLAEPVTVLGPEADLMITALVGTEEYTELKFRLQGQPPPPLGPQMQGWSSGSIRLLLPDGTELPQIGGLKSIRDGYADGNFVFAALPPKTDAVVLELPAGLYGSQHLYKVELRLTDPDGVLGAPAIPGGQSRELHGVTLVVPYFSYTDDRVAVVIDAESRVPGKLQSVNGLALHSDRRHAFSQLTEESVLMADFTLRPVSATFAGPTDEAKWVTLTVDKIRMWEEGEATLTVPLEKLPVGQPLSMHEHVRVGMWALTVRSVTRDAEELTVEMDVSKPPTGIELQSIDVSASGTGPTVRRSGFFYNATTGRYTATATLAIDGDNIRLNFSRPLVRITGPWHVALPLRPD